MSYPVKPTNLPFWLSPAYNTRSRAYAKGKASPKFPPKSEKAKFSPYTGHKGYKKTMTTEGTPSASAAATANPGDSSQYAGPSQSSSAQPGSVFGAPTTGNFEAKSLTPSLFHGSPSEDAKAWLLYFKRYALFRKFSNEDLLTVFPLFLRAAATDWFDQLSDEVRADFAELETSFLARFTTSDFMRWVRVSDMFSRVQKQNETVDEYVVQVQKMAKAVDMKDDNFIRYAILKGLKPNIRCYVLQNDAKTVPEVLRLGRIAEQTVANNASLLCELKQDKNIAQLEMELNKLATTVQKLAVGNVGDASKSAPRGGRRRQPARRPQFTQTGQWQDQSMAQAQQPPQPPLPPPILGVRLPPPPRPPYTGQRQAPATPGQGFSCSRCGRRHFSFRDCPARNSHCYTCQAIGHYSRMCNRTAQPNQFSA